LAHTTHGQNRLTALLNNRRFMGFLALTLAAALAIQVGMPLGVNFVEEVRGFGVQVVGVLGSVNSLGVVLLNVLFGQRPPRRSLLLAQILLMASLGLLLYTSGLFWLIVAFGLRAGWSLARNMASAQARRAMEAHESGMAFGIFETVYSLALILGPLIAGQLYTQAPELPFQVSAVGIVLTIPLMWFLSPRHPEAQSEETPAPPSS
jgi:hypothetical protein